MCPCNVLDDDGDNDYNVGDQQKEESSTAKGSLWHMKEKSQY